MSHEMKNISLNNIEVYVKNPRFEPQVDENAEMAKILSNKKTIKLIEHIAENGPDPSDLLLVVYSEELGHYISMEGNRRLTSIKTLNAPENIPYELPEREKLIKKVKRIREANNYTPIESLNCVYFHSEDDPLLYEWIKIKHDGESDGAGRVRWDSPMKGRFSKTDDFRNFFVNFLEEFYGSLDSNFGITNLDRLLQDPDIRTIIGITIDRRNQEIRFVNNDAKKKLYYIIQGFSTKKFQVGDIYTKEDRKIFADQFLIKNDDWKDSPINFASSSYPIQNPPNEDTNTEKTDETPKENAAKENEPFEEETSPGNDVNSTPDPDNNHEITTDNGNEEKENTQGIMGEDGDETKRQKRTTDIYKSKKLIPTVFDFQQHFKQENKIVRTLRELKKIDVDEFQISSIFLIRSLLESYVHVYIDEHLKDGLPKVKGVAKQRDKRKDLRELLLQIKSHLETHYEVHAEIPMLIHEISNKSDNNNPMTSLINFYVHSTISFPEKRTVIDSWIKTGPIIQCLDSILVREIKLKQPENTL
ncbi:hypothetical protein GLV98_12390 [Halobacillus litoralis]|uniref:ParB/Sulfiredoxin domain-containing protein n=1 Tax=Halobacillus litoralis TaxID=45668 RepID=A0A845EGF5_9BACI|nr:hypothetical protein [Halobacillus litoralis]MYL50288.1 hypothetical protein [Halobacillus litoralis]